jgi:glycerol kinase
MSDAAVLAIDQGTTNSKAVLVDVGGRIIARGSAPVAIEHPAPGHVQQDAEDIWLSVLAAVDACLLEQPDVRVAAVGISNQRESVVAWKRSTGEPVGPVITWQCRRTAAWTNALKSEGVEPQVIAKTGLPLDPLFPAHKIRWLLEAAGTTDDIVVGTVDSWLIWNLTNGAVHATDLSNASRTQLLDIRSGQWDDDLCRMFGVPIEVLPDIRDSQGLFGRTHGIGRVPDGTLVGSAIGDSHGALFGHGAFRPGDSKATFGTGSSVMMNVPEFVVPPHGLTTTIAWSIDGRITYALEGNILVSASLFPWLATLLGLDGDVGRLLELASSVEDSGGVAIVPAMVGLGAPHWEPEARGLIAGLSFASTPAHIARAAAASVALQVADVFEAMRRRSDAAEGAVYVDGGPSSNRFLMGLVAGHLGRTVEVGLSTEVSALGAATLAGLAAGCWADLEVVSHLERKREEVQSSATKEAIERDRTAWQDAMARCLLRPSPMA